MSARSTAFRKKATESDFCMEEEGSHRSYHARNSWTPTSAPGGSARPDLSELSRARTEQLIDNVDTKKELETQFGVW
jgi:hypothetical protein